MAPAAEATKASSPKNRTWVELAWRPAATDGSVTVVVGRTMFKAAATYSYWAVVGIIVGGYTFVGVSRGATINIGAEGVAYAYGIVGVWVVMDMVGGVVVAGVLVSVAGTAVGVVGGVV